MYKINNKANLDIAKQLNINALENHGTANINKLFLRNISINNGTLTASYISSNKKIVNTNRASIKVGILDNVKCDNSGRFILTQETFGNVEITGVLTLDGNIIQNNSLQANIIEGTKSSFTNKGNVATNRIAVDNLNNRGDMQISQDATVIKIFNNQGSIVLDTLVMATNTQFTNSLDANLTIAEDLHLTKNLSFTNLGTITIGGQFIIDNNFNNQGYIRAANFDGNKFEFTCNKQHNADFESIKDVKIQVNDARFSVSKQILGEVTLTGVLELAGDVEQQGNLNLAGIDFNGHKLVNNSGATLVIESDDTFIIHENNFENHGDLLVKQSGVELSSDFNNTGFIITDIVDGNQHILNNSGILACNTIKNIIVRNSHLINIGKEITGFVNVTGKLTLSDDIIQYGNFTADAFAVEKSNDDEDNNENINFTILTNSETHISHLENTKINVINDGILTSNNNMQLQSYVSDGGILIISIDENTDFTKPLLATDGIISIQNHSKQSLVSIAPLSETKLGIIKDRACLLKGTEIKLNDRKLEQDMLEDIIGIKKLFSSSGSIIINISALSIERDDASAQVFANLTCEDATNITNLKDMPVSIKKFFEFLKNTKIKEIKNDVMAVIRSEIKHEHLPVHIEEIVESVLVDKHVNTYVDFINKIQDSIIATADPDKQKDIIKKLVPDNSATNPQNLLCLSKHAIGHIKKHFAAIRKAEIRRHSYWGIAPGSHSKAVPVWTAFSDENGFNNKDDRYFNGSSSSKVASVGMEDEFTKSLKIGAVFSYSSSKLNNISLGDSHQRNSNSDITSVLSSIYAQYNINNCALQGALLYGKNSHKQTAQLSWSGIQATTSYYSSLTALMLELVCPYKYNKLYFEFNSSAYLVNTSIPKRNFNGMEIYYAQRHNLFSLVTGSYVSYKLNFKNLSWVNFALGMSYSYNLGLNKNDNIAIELLGKHFNIKQQRVNYSAINLDAIINIKLMSGLFVDIDIAYQHGKRHHVARAKTIVKYKF